MEVDNTALSLLERMGGPRRGGVRSGVARRSASAPYQNRRDALGSSNADTDGMWKHDKHEESAGGSLAARLQGREARPRPDISIVQNHIRPTRTAIPATTLAIKGASAPIEPIVEVKGLVAGTTPEDVKAIFQSCGAITKAKLASTSTPQSPHVLLYYTKQENALSAVSKFNGLPADGQKLQVAMYSLEQKVQSGGKNEDLLIPQQQTSGKMYSDEIAATDPRAHVVVGDFTPSPPSRGGRWGRGRRGRGGPRRGGTSRMDIDN